MRQRTLSLFVSGAVVLAVGACGGAVADDDAIVPAPPSGVTPLGGGQARASAGKREPTRANAGKRGRARQSATKCA